MADTACRQFQATAPKSELCSNCQKPQREHSPVPAKRTRGPSQRAATKPGAGKDKNGATSNSQPETKTVTKQGSTDNEVNAGSDDRRSNKPAVASKPKQAIRSKPTQARKPEPQTDAAGTRSKENSQSPDAGSSQQRPCPSGDVDAKPKGTVKTTSRPRVPPPKAPDDKAAKSTDSGTPRSVSPKVYIEGLSPPIKTEPETDRLTQDKLKSSAAASGNQDGGSHYYHTYDVTGSVSKKLSKPLDRRKERVKEDQKFIPPYRVVDIAKQPVASPYNVVDVTACRKSCAGSSTPPKLPTTLPPERDRSCSPKSSSSEPNSREGTWKGSKGRVKASSGESLAECRMPFILQEEAARMREESRSPPPARKVPIMIPPQPSDNISDTYEEIADACGETGDVTQNLDAASDISDYSQTNVGCLSFPRHSKSKVSKTAVLDTKMAALANLDLLKGIAGKDAPSADTDTARQVCMSRADSDPGLDAGTTTDTKPTDKSKKQNKSFFKKLLSFGSRESPQTEDLESHTLDADQRVLAVDVQATTGDTAEESSPSRPAVVRKPVSAREDRHAMLSEFQTALARRQVSAPDICQELVVHRPTSPDIGDRGGADTPVTTDSSPPTITLVRKKKNMNINIQKQSPSHEGKINNIIQAEEMARSLGIDKVSPRNKTASPESEVGPAVTEASTSGTAQRINNKPAKPTKPAIDLLDNGQTFVKSASVADEPEPSTSTQRHSPAKAKRTLDPKKPNDLNKVPTDSEDHYNLQPKQRPDTKPNIPVKSTKAKGRHLLSDTTTDAPEHSKSPQMTKAPYPVGGQPGAPIYDAAASYDPGDESVSTQPPSPTHDVRKKKPRPTSEIRTGKMSRSRMPAPPPPPGTTNPPVSPQPGAEADSARLTTRRPTGIKPSDISGPILTTDRMTRSVGSPTDMFGSMAAENGARQKTNLEPSSNGAASPENGSEFFFDTFGRRSGKFLNRALPPTPLSQAAEKPKTPPSSLHENEYELVSLDGDAPERARTHQRAPYEDIDLPGEGVYSDPLELLGGNSQRAADDQLGDDYLEPASGSGEDDKPVPLPRIVCKRNVLQRSHSHNEDSYTNRHVELHSKPALTVKDGFQQMCSLNVQTLSILANKIVFNLIPARSEFVDDLKWSDFALKSTGPLLKIGDLTFYETRSGKVKPHDCFIVVSSRCLSRSLLEWRSPSTIVPVSMFRDRIPGDFLRTPGSSQYDMRPPEETNVGVLGYTSLTPLAVWLDGLDSVFTSDLTEYERRVCLCGMQIITAVLDLSDKWPQISEVCLENVLMVTSPGCADAFPLVVLPDMVSCSPDKDGASAPVKSKPNWRQLGLDVLKILFKMLRLEYDKNDPSSAVPIRTKFSQGIKRIVNQLTKTQGSISCLISAKFLTCCMLWGPETELLRPLMAAKDRPRACQCWLEVRRCTVVNEVAAGSCHNTLEFVNKLSYLCSANGKVVSESVNMLQG